MNALNQHDFRPNFILKLSKFELNLFSVKKDLLAAITFALGATPNQIHKAQLKDIPLDADESCFVELELDCGQTYKVRRILNTDGWGQLTETFEIDTVRQLTETLEIDSVQYEIDTVQYESDQYKSELKKLKFDLDKQIHFYDAANRKMFWNMITSEQDELIGTLTNTTPNIRRMAELKLMIEKMDAQLQEKRRKLRNLVCLTFLYIVFYTLSAS